MKRCNYWITYILCLMFAVNSYLTMQLIFTELTLENKIDIYEQVRTVQLNTIHHSLKKSIKELVKTNQIRKTYLKETEKTNEKYEEIRKKYNLLEPIDLKNSAEIKEANVTVDNFTTTRFGSGTHIKINDKSYILTVAHLLKDENDNVQTRFNDNKFHVLKLVKYDRKVDLALFRIYNVKDKSYLEISNTNPKIGSKVIVIGNPDIWEDIITEGVIASISDKNYLITNKVYYGNSGGAVIYKGKIIGVLSRIVTLYNIPVFYTVGESSTLNKIQEFLEDVK